MRLARRNRASAVIVTPAFFPGSSLKDAVVILTLRTFTTADIVGWVHMDPFRLDLEKKPRWYRRLATEVFQRVDYWVACAPTLMNCWPGFLPADRRYAITNGIEAPAIPRRVSAPGRLRVVYLSAMHQEKGWRDLFKPPASFARGATMSSSISMGMRQVTRLPMNCTLCLTDCTKPTGLVAWPRMGRR